MEKLKNAKVAVFGIGGVGSFVCEGLARGGIGNFILVDYDKIDESNINNPEVTLNFDNFELLCQDCHNHEHHSKHKATVDGLRFNAKGELIQI